jgi:hypothetical protein
MNLVIYRGPLERARLRFIFETIQQKYGDFNFVWIAPVRLSAVQRIKSIDFIQQSGISHFTILEHSKWFFLQTIFAIKKIVNRQPLHFLGMIGFSSLEYSLGLNAAYTAWYINGVPEERFFYKNNMASLITVKSEWFLKNQFIDKVNIVVTVSSRMTRIAANNIGKAHFFHAPTCTDLSLYSKKTTVQKKVDFCYMGSGAPWQALHLLKPIWDELYLLNPGFTFRIVSRDLRCKVLMSGIPSTNIEMVGDDDFNKVAQWTSECSYGFLIREDHLVNRVSFPTKLAEYLAAGCKVILSDIDWDLPEYVDVTSALLVNPKAQPKETARQIYEMIQKSKDDAVSLPVNTNEDLLKFLSKEYWVSQTIHAYSV